jgi:hypothetical protein
MKHWTDPFPLPLRRAYEDPHSDEFTFERLEPSTKQNEYALSKIKMAMLARARQASFQQQLANTFDSLDIPYKRTHAVGDILADFLITINCLEHVDMSREGGPTGECVIERQIALVCELDPYADKPTMQKLAQHVWTSLCTDEALVIVPHREDTYFRFQVGKRNWALTDKEFIEHILRPTQEQEAHIDRSGTLIRKSELSDGAKAPRSYPIR